MSTFLQEIIMRPTKLGTPSSKSSNLDALQNFRYTPLAAIANLVVAPAVSDEEIARRQAEQKQAKADKAKVKAEAKAAQEARAKALPPQPRLAILPDEATLAMLERQRRARLERAEHVAKMAPIPAEVLEKGLEADKAEEAKRREEEVVKAKLLKEGYRMDVHKSALSVLFNNSLVMEAKVLAIEELGFSYSHDHTNGRDAFYFHEKSGDEVRVTGGALGETNTKRAHKPCGVELLTPEKIAERQAANAKLREEGRMKRLAKKASGVKTPRPDKKAKKEGDDKKSKKGGK